MIIPNLALEVPDVLRPNLIRQDQNERTRNVVQLLQHEHQVLNRLQLPQISNKMVQNLRLLGPVAPPVFVEQSRQRLHVFQGQMDVLDQLVVLEVPQLENLRVGQRPHDRLDFRRNVRVVQHFFFVLFDVVFVNFLLNFVLVFAGNRRVTCLVGFIV